MASSLNDESIFGKTQLENSKIEQLKVDFFTYLGKFAKDIQKLSFTEEPKYE